MMDEILFEVHHGGLFVRDPLLRYIMGQKKYFILDIDKFGYVEIMAFITKDLGYQDVSKVHWCLVGRTLHNNLRLVLDDNSTADMLSAMDQTEKDQAIELYVEHELGESNTMHVDEIGDSNQAVVDAPSEEVYNMAYDDCTMDEEGEDDTVYQEDDRIVELHVDDDIEARSIDVSDDELRDIRVEEYEKSKGKKKKKKPAEEDFEDLFDTAISIGEMDGNLSDVPDSDDPDSDAPDSGGEDVPIRKKPKCPVWNPKRDLFTFIPELWQRFKDTRQLRDCITGYAVKKGLGIWFDKISKDVCLAKCQKGCLWRLWATKMTYEDSIQIKSLYSEHNCSRTFHVKLVTAEFLAKVYHQKLLDNPQWKLKDFQDDVLHRYAIDVTIQMCGRARARAMGGIDTALIEHYARLRDYGEEIVKKNPGTLVDIRVERVAPTEDNPDSGGPTFKCMYISFPPLIEDFLQGCRPVFGLDGCFLKGFVKGELLTAVGRDANNQMFPFAWAVVTVENKENWSWFLEHLMVALNTREGAGWTIITDKQKGLVPAIAELLPRAEHRMCARHVYANMRKGWLGAQLKILFWSASKAGTKQEFEMHMKDIKKISNDAYEYLMKQDPIHWARAFFSTTSCCDAVENNMCETFNGKIVEARSKLIFWMLESIKKYVIGRMERTRIAIERWRGKNNKYTPRIKKNFEDNKLAHRFWRCHYNGKQKFEISLGEDQFTVVINKNDKTGSCSCRMWALSGVPCCHAIKAIYYLEEEPEEYIAEWYTVEKWMKAYDHYINPVDGPSMWPKSNCEPILPPLDRKMPGRPKKARNKGANEERTSKGGGKRISKAGCKMSCSNCGVQGHNKSKCNLPPRPYPLPRRRYSKGLEPPCPAVRPTKLTVKRNVAQPTDAAAQVNKRKRHASQTSQAMSSQAGLAS